MNYEHYRKVQGTPPQQAEMLLRALSLFGMSDYQRGRPSSYIHSCHHKTKPKPLKSISNL